MDEEDAWNKLLQKYSEFNVLVSLIEHTSEIEVERYKKLGLNYSSKTNRYHNHVSFSNIDGSLVKLKTQSFNIEQRVEYLEKVENNQYKALLVDIYSDFKRFVLSKYRGEKEIELLIQNGCTETYHNSYEVNLFHVATLAMVLRNVISHNNNELTSHDDLRNRVFNAWSKGKYVCNSEEKKQLSETINKFIDNGHIKLTKKLVSPGLYLPRINFIINSLLSYAYHIKNKT